MSNILRDGDRVIVSVRTNSTQNLDGITSGGQWVEHEGIYKSMSSLGGTIRDDVGNFIQTVDSELDAISCYKIRRA